MTNITIPDSVIVIGHYAFQDCTSLTSITIPDSVTVIRDDAFTNCSGSLTINSKIIETDYAYNNRPSSRWLCNSKFTELILGDNIEKIGSNTFYDCKLLTSVAIPDSVTSIGNGAFFGCYSLTSIYITDLLTWCRIDFSNATANPLNNGKATLDLNGVELVDITIPSNIKAIKSYVFKGYTSLRSVTIPDSVTSIGNGAFYGCDSLTNLTIGNGVTTIGEETFANCSDLTSVTIPDSVTSIGNSAFLQCKSLTNVTIPDSVTSIEYNTFMNCSSLTSVTIGNGVTSIGKEAFYYCTSMQYYDFSTHESIPSLANTSAFFQIPSTCKIIVPDALYDEWIAATNWSEYASYIIKKSDWDASQTTE